MPKKQTEINQRRGLSGYGKGDMMFKESIVKQTNVATTLPLHTIIGKIVLRLKAQSRGRFGMAALMYLAAQDDKTIKAMLKEAEMHIEKCKGVVHKK